MQLVKYLLIFLFLTSLPIWILGLRKVLKTRETLSWPTTEGRVEGYELVPRRMSHQTNSYEAKGELVYHVDGAEHRRSKLSPEGDPVLDLERAAEIFSDDPVPIVAVHYNPEDPDEAAITPVQAKADTWLLVTLSVLMLGFLIGIIMIPASAPLATPVSPE